MDSHFKSRAKAALNNSKFYNTGKACKHGHLSDRLTTDGHCMECNRERDKARYPYRAESRLVYLKQYRKDNAERILAYDRERYRRPDRYKAKLISNRLREKIVRQSMAYPHERKDIIQFYKDRPEGMHVHHVVPLQHEAVCGLTSLNNLIYLSGPENMSLGNRLDLTTVT